MINKILQIGSLLFLVVTFAVVSVNAQKAVQLKAQIPFDFNIGKNNYKADGYSVVLKNPTENPATMMMQTVDGRNLQIGFVLQSGKKSRAGKTTMTFNRYANQYFLAEINSTEFALALPKSKLERQVAKNFKQKNLRPERVALILTIPEKNVE